MEQKTEKAGNTVKLGIKQRINLLNLMPENSTFTERITIRGIENELNFTEEEKKRVNLRDERDKFGRPIINWDNESEKKFLLTDDRLAIIKKSIFAFIDKNKDIPMFLTVDMLDNLKFTKNEEKRLKQAVDELDKNGKINDRNFEVCEKFING